MDAVDENAIHAAPGFGGWGGARVLPCGGIMENSDEKKLEEMIEDYWAICSLLGIHYIDNELHKSNTTEDNLIQIDEIIRKLVIGEIVRSYTWIDYAMNDVMINYFITRKDKSYLIKKDAFINKIADKISFCNKLEVVREIYDIPKSEYKKIQKIKDLRNDLAHNYSPEDRNKTKAVYGSKSIFTEPGMSLFVSDFIEIQQYFVKLAPFG